MKAHVYITETGERVRERDGLVEVSLSSEAQAALGKILHFQAPRNGVWVEKGDRLFVVEGTLTAAEFYASASGRVKSLASTMSQAHDWFVWIKTSS